MTFLRSSIVYGGKDRVNDLCNKSNLGVKLLFRLPLEPLFAAPSRPLCLTNGAGILQMWAHRLKIYPAVAGNGFGGAP